LFPLQNAFALTVHKTQSITLPHSTFGQAYVTMTSWINLTLDEYDKLQEIYDKNIRNSLLKLFLFNCISYLNLYWVFKFYSTLTPHENEHLFSSKNNLKIYACR
jgi:hypothetical protein